MKGSWTLVASVLAVSTAALSSTTYADRDVSIFPCINQGKPTNSLALVGKKDNCSPRFDGLKFIETLITGHRYRMEKYVVRLNEMLPIKHGKPAFIVSHWPEDARHYLHGHLGRPKARSFDKKGAAARTVLMIILAILVIHRKTKSRRSESVMGENESSGQLSGLSKNTEDPWEKLDVKWKMEVYLVSDGQNLAVAAKDVAFKEYLKISRYADGIQNQELNYLLSKADFGASSLLGLEKSFHMVTSETSGLVASETQFVGNTMKSPMFGVTTLRQASPYP